MCARVNGRRVAAFVMGLGLVLGASACGGDGDGAATTQEEAIDLPPEVRDRQNPPDPSVFLPPLEDYATDDHLDPGEIEASLDDAPVPYADVRRRLILDEQAFAVGEVTAVTMEPDSAGGESYLDHRYGEAPRTTTEVAGVEMLRVETDPYDAIAWTGPTFAVTFERGQERSDEWLEDVARATVEGMSQR